VLLLCWYRLLNFPRHIISSLNKGVNVIKSFLTDKRAAGGVVFVLISMVVMILIGIVVVQALITSQTQAGWSAAANTAWTNMQSSIWVAMGLIIVGIVVVGAVAILSMMRMGKG